MTNEQKVQLLKLLFTNDKGIIDLSDLDFGDAYVNFSKIKAQYINNSRQEALKSIGNWCQKAEVIENWSQEAEEIDNRSQRAKIKKEVDNELQ